MRRRTNLTDPTDLLHSNTNKNSNSYLDPYINQGNVDGFRPADSYKENNSSNYQRYIPDHGSANKQNRWKNISFGNTSVLAAIGIILAILAGGYFIIHYGPGIAAGIGNFLSILLASAGAAFVLWIIFCIACGRRIPSRIKGLFYPVLFILMYFSNYSMQFMHMLGAVIVVMVIVAVIARMM